MITLHLNTRSRVELVEITELVRNVVKSSGVDEGICTVYVPHTTAGVTINEHADPSVVSDIIMQLAKIVPATGAYSHSEGNSDAHIKASLMGSSQSIIITNGDLALGTWQGIFFCEFDGPRNRKILVKIA
jgi:secondary thiamine-phosphate synthase enzyme